MKTWQGTPVSLHPCRVVHRLEIPTPGGGRTLYLKRGWSPSLMSLVARALVGQSPGARVLREVEAARRFQQLGIPTADVLGYGVRYRAGVADQGFILLEGLANKVSVHARVRPTLTGSAPIELVLRKACIRLIAKTCRRFHDAQLRWPDLVGKHLLIDADRPPADLTLHVIDLERVHEDAGEITRRRDLLALLGSLPPGCVRRSDLLRFVRHYEGRPGAGGRAFRSMLRARWDWASAVWKDVSQTRPPAAGLTLGKDVRFAGVVVNETYAELFLANGFTGYPSVQQWLSRQMRPDVRRESLFVELRTPGGEPVRLRVHTYRRPSLSDQLRRIRRMRATRSTAWWEWAQARASGRRGWTTEIPVAFGEKMKGIFEKSSFVVFHLREEEGASSYCHPRTASAGGRRPRLTVRRGRSPCPARPLPRATQTHQRA